MLKLVSTNLKDADYELVIIPVCEDSGIHRDKTVTDLIQKALSYSEFNGEKEQSITFYDIKGIMSPRIVLRGLGKFDQIDPETIRAACGKSVKQANSLKLSQTAFLVPDNFKKMKMPLLLQAMMEGAFLANHKFDKYKQKDQKKSSELHFLLPAQDVSKFEKLRREVEIICQSTVLARNWVNTPSNDKFPARLAELITEHAKNSKALKIRVLDEKELGAEKFGSILAVAAGSRNPARMLIMEYKPESSANTVVLIGKGVTYDSGGMNLKTSGSLSDMKVDMAGGAAVAAFMIAAADLRMKGKNFIGIIPMVENMISGSAMRAGDVIRGYSGKTIEIGNTDAEGRLILADAISYAIETYSPSEIIDLATLTGACITALGEKIAGVFSSDDRLAESILKAGRKTGERCWQMPLPDDYRELLDSDIAEINNMPKSRSGGAITAALFLKEFAGDSTWAHIDIAGPAFLKKENAYCGSGGTGFGVRLLYELLRGNENEQ